VIRGFWQWLCDWFVLVMACREDGYPDDYLALSADGVPGAGLPGRATTTPGDSTPAPAPVPLVVVPGRGLPEGVSPDEVDAIRRHVAELREAREIALRQMDGYRDVFERIAMAVPDEDAFSRIVKRSLHFVAGELGFREALREADRLGIRELVE